MSNMDASSYTLRFNEVSQTMEYAVSGRWVAVPAATSANTFVYNEIPSGTVNGSNVTFTLAHSPLSGLVSVYYNGVKQNPNSSSDYSISGAVITFTTAPTAGVILADYQY